MPSTVRHYSNCMVLEVCKTQIAISSVHSQMM